jgi:16S rRNA (cytosine1402-N4)-methyltransferase
MVEEVDRALRIEGDATIADGTLGTGGHAARLLARHGRMRLLGIDRDGELLEEAMRRLAPFADRVVFRRASYADLGEVLHETGWRSVDGVLLDLGVCSAQLARGARGFSFMRDGPLDLRFDASCGESAAELLDRLSEAELADVLRRFGEERAARGVARVLKERRPRTTAELADAVSRAKGGRRGRRLHPATKTFQALRIAVNRELDHLDRFLRRFHRFLVPGGRAAVISYHSLEDRAVKRSFGRLSAEGVGRVLTRRPVRPAAEESVRNRRSRGAKLRVFERGPS